MRFVFLHGGPGFNSFAEQAMLGPLFLSGGHEIAFWNEPSALRPGGDSFEATGALRRWLSSAEQMVLGAAASSPVHLIAHSITAHAALEIARRHASRLSSLVLVTPGADAFLTYCSVLRLAREDLADTKPEIASALADTLARTRVVMDDAMREGMWNVLNDERLFTHYWADAHQMQAAIAARSRPDAQFDVDSFFAVLGEWQQGAAHLSSAPITLPTLALFGAADRVTAAGEQLAALRAAVPVARVEVVENCSHYLHLDRPQHFVDIVVAWATENDNTCS